MAIGSALAVTGCSQSPRNPANPVEATYVPHEASASGDDGAPLDASGDDGAPLDVDDDFAEAPAVKPPPPIWPDAALADAALGTHVDGGFVCASLGRGVAARGRAVLGMVISFRRRVICN
jgi:hypothetical protein